MATIHPCPRCGATNEDDALELIEEGMAQPIYVQCRKCGYAGPVQFGISSAIVSWNALERPGAA